MNIFERIFKTQELAYLKKSLGLARIDLRDAHLKLDRIEKARDLWRENAFGERKLLSRLTQQDEANRASLNRVTEAKDLFYRNWTDTVAVLTNMVHENLKLKREHERANKIMEGQRQCNLEQAAAIERFEATHKEMQALLANERKSVAGLERALTLNHEAAEADGSTIDNLQAELRMLKHQAQCGFGLAPAHEEGGIEAFDPNAMARGVEDVRDMIGAALNGKLKGKTGDAIKLLRKVRRRLS